jgi:AcrR family transcriptional regulator
VVDDASVVADDLRARRRRRVADEIERRALALFAERGFDNTTVQEIAAASEISERTFFRYFPTKEAVLRRDLDRRVAQLEAALDERPPEESAVVATRNALLELAAKYEADSENVMAWTRVITATPGLGVQLGAYQYGFSESVKELIAERLQVDPKTDLGAHVAAAAMLAAANAASSLWLARGARQPLVPMVEQALDFVERGLQTEIEHGEGERPSQQANSSS